ncbi:O-antigen polymerase [Staphylococcus delphini]|uniref:O-antigen ligase family protein n=1 Tax=Staphylococcus delphini TaxID=53344 RepID=UPI00374E2F41
MKNKIFILLLGLFFVLQLINQLYMPIPSMIQMGIVILLFLIVEKQSLLGLFCFTIMLSSSVLLYVENIIFVVALIYKFRKEIRISKAFIVVILIFLWELTHVFINVNNGFNESLIYTIGFGTCLLPFAIIKNIAKAMNVRKTLYLFFIGYFGFTIIIFLSYYQTFGTFDITGNVNRFGYSAHAGTEDINSRVLLINPNTIGIYSALIISSVIVLRHLKRLRIDFLSVMMLIYALFIGLMTLSRTFILVTVLTIFIYFIVQINNKFILRWLMLISTVLLTVYFVLSQTQIIDMLKRRIFETNDISGNRLTIFNQYIHLVFREESILFFGVGMQNYIEKIKRFNGYIDSATHNIVLEVLTIWGILGIVLVLFLFYSSIDIKNLKEIGRLSDIVVKLLPLLVVIISAFFGQYFISFYHTFCFTFYALLILNVKEVRYFD